MEDVAQGKSLKFLPTIDFGLFVANGFIPYDMWQNKQWACAEDTSKNNHHIAFDK
jgi:hypothetical protein